MSALQTAIKSVIGPSEAGSGYGEKWYWLIDPVTDDYKRGQAQNEIAVGNLKSAFECWQLTRLVPLKSGDLQNVVDYIFIVKNRKGKYLGVCQIPEKILFGSIDDDSIVIINYTDFYKTEEEVHEYNKAMEHMTEYVKV